MNEAQAKELINDVLEEDRIIHEQQLGLPWSRPALYVYFLYLISSIDLEVINHSNVFPRN